MALVLYNIVMEQQHHSIIKVLRFQYLLTVQDITGLGGIILRVPITLFLGVSLILSGLSRAYRRRSAILLCRTHQCCPILFTRKCKISKITYHATCRLHYCTYCDIVILMLENLTFSNLDYLRFQQTTGLVAGADKKPSTFRVAN